MKREFPKRDYILKIFRVPIHIYEVREVIETVRNAVVGQSRGR